jgi:primase-polymerase (primpol)-like protein
MQTPSKGALAEQLHLVPAELRAQRQWVAWKYVPDASRAKPKKLPLSAATGGAASSVDPQTWSSFDQVVEFCDRDNLDGVGFVFSAGDDYCGVDLDNCVALETGVVRDASVLLIDELDSYTELSPSGSGVHIIAMARLPGKGRKTGSVEMYDRGRFFTVTGRPLGTSRPITKRQREIEQLYARLQPNRDVAGPAQESRRLSGPELPDATVLDLIRASRRRAAFQALYSGRWQARHSSQSEADLALTGLIADFVGNNRAQIDRIFRGSALYRPKWDDQRGDDTYGERTIKKALGE